MAAASDDAPGVTRPAKMAHVEGGPPKPTSFGSSLDRPNNRDGAQPNVSQAQPNVKAPPDELDKVLAWIQEDSISHEERLMKNIEDNMNKLNSNAIRKYESVAARLADNFITALQRNRQRLTRKRNATVPGEYRDEVAEDIAQVVKDRYSAVARREQQIEDGEVPVEADGRFSSAIRRSGGFPANIPSGTFISPSTLYRYMLLVRAKYANHLNLPNTSDVFLQTDADFIPAYFNTANGSCVTGGFSPSILQSAPLNSIYVGEPLSFHRGDSFVRITRLDPTIVSKLEEQALAARSKQLRRLQMWDYILEIVNDKADLHGQAVARKMSRKLADADAAEQHTRLGLASAPGLTFLSKGKNDDYFSDS